MYRSSLCLHVVCEVYKHPVASADRVPTHFLHFFPRASELRRHYGDTRFVQQYAWPLPRGPELRLAVWTRSKVLHSTCHCPRGFRERCGQPPNRRGCCIWKRQHHIPSARSRCQSASAPPHQFRSPSKAKGMSCCTAINRDARWFFGHLESWLSICPHRRRRCLRPGPTAHLPRH